MLVEKDCAVMSVPYILITFRETPGEPLTGQLTPSRFNWFCKISPARIFCPRGYLQRIPC